ncbi:MAG: recombination protein NinG [Bacteroidetes bacterium]|nr:recombination protein NinG [Bacteroidota bacterium]
MKKTISKLKKELDTIFSVFIRLREANEYGYCQCFTCGVVRHYKDGMQNGHFQSRKHLSTRFSEDGNCEVQCVSCNIFGSGQQWKFGMNLDAKYGEGRAVELEFLARTTLKISRAEYEEKISYYKNLVENLKEEKGIE